MVFTPSSSSSSLHTVSAFDLFIEAEPFVWCLPLRGWSLRTHTHTELLVIILFLLYLIFSDNHIKKLFIHSLKFFVLKTETRFIFLLLLTPVFYNSFSFFCPFPLTLTILCKCPAASNSARPFPPVKTHTKPSTTGSLALFSSSLHSRLIIVIDDEDSDLAEEEHEVIGTVGFFKVYFLDCFMTV